jgi:hypothetical protein
VIGEANPRKYVSPEKQKITLIFATATVPTTINNLNCFS